MAGLLNSMNRRGAGMVRPTRPMGATAETPDMVSAPSQGLPQQVRQGMAVQPAPPGDVSTVGDAEASNADMDSGIPVTATGTPLLASRGAIVLPKGAMAKRFAEQAAEMQAFQNPSGREPQTGQPLGVPPQGRPPQSQGLQRRGVISGQQGRGQGRPEWAGIPAWQRTNLESWMEKFRPGMIPAVGSIGNASRPQRPTEQPAPITQENPEA
jgi:hypothetical protein